MVFGCKTVKREPRLPLLVHKNRRFIAGVISAFLNIKLLFDIFSNPPLYTTRNFTKNATAG